jgi:hypothetical protein
MSNVVRQNGSDGLETQRMLQVLVQTPKLQQLHKW